jgi:peptidoglycan/xylan/chitin deacetylase (PgdA/CDA1 family)
VRNRWALGATAGLLAVTVAGVAIPRAVAGAHRDPSDASGPLDLRAVAVDQVRQNVRLKAETSGPFGLGTLARQPNTSQSRDRFLCLKINRSGRNIVRQLCFGKRSNGDADTLGYAQLKPDGSIRSWKAVRARVKRPIERVVVASFRPEAADLRPHHYRWRYVSQWTGRRCPSPDRSKRDPCFDRAPNRHKARFTLRAVQPVGCKDSAPSPVYHGRERHKRIALTFDDGPSAYTPKILSILKRKHAKATFFELGFQVSSASRAVLKAGQELANHSYRHESYPSRSSMAATNARIRAASGFTPCLFRPPGGAYNSRVLGDARSLGMTTVLWNVDPRDWSNPGSGAIYSRVVSASRPGAIVVMHDGGGDRSQTVAALPDIIRELRNRGYRMVTVSRLLGQRTIWDEAQEAKHPLPRWGPPARLGSLEIAGPE